MQAILRVMGWMDKFTVCAAWTPERRVDRWAVKIRVSIF